MTGKAPDIGVTRYGRDFGAQDESRALGFLPRGSLRFFPGAMPGPSDGGGGAGLAHGSGNPAEPGVKSLSTEQP